MFVSSKEKVFPITPVKTWSAEIYQTIESEFLFRKQNGHVKDKEWIEEFKKKGPICYAYCLILIKDFDKNEVIDFAEEVLGLTTQVK